MTCVVGLEHAGAVYLGGDSALTYTDSGSIVVVRDPKVFARGPLVIGTSNDARILQLVGHSFDPPEHADGVDDMRYVVVDLVAGLKSLLRKNRLLKKGKEEGDSHEAQHLVGYRGAVYLIDTDFQAQRATCGWAAIGSGADIALGSLHTSARRGMSPKERVMAALRASEAHNAHVRRPFHVIRLDKEKA